jgi:hypothetical protein
MKHDSMMNLEHYMLGTPDPQNHSSNPASSKKYENRKGNKP